mmetsp:Transcript_57241/g.145380  ORF Transcript_57241/g.145380 Transcript_57241/m.145380 type:complete len:224 (-) Transcript_57241:122-793(-)
MAAPSLFRCRPCGSPLGESCFAIERNGCGLRWRRRCNWVAGRRLACFWFRRQSSMGWWRTRTKELMSLAAVLHLCWDHQPRPVAVEEFHCASWFRCSRCRARHVWAHVVVDDGCNKQDDHQSYINLPTLPTVIRGGGRLIVAAGALSDVVEGLHLAIATFALSNKFPLDRVHGAGGLEAHLLCATTSACTPGLHLMHLIGTRSLTDRRRKCWRRQPHSAATCD